MYNATYREKVYFCFKFIVMENKFNSPGNEIQFHYKIWLSDKKNQGILGDGKWQILKLIEEKGSLKAACDELGYTYRRTWGNLKKIENFFGFPLLEKHRGGSDGGRTLLTPEGKKLVKAFDHFHNSIDSVIQLGFKTFLQELS
jgi:molybdate transport system regulatory protein